MSIFGFILNFQGALETIGLTRKVMGWERGEILLARLFSHFFWFAGIFFDIKLIFFWGGGRDSPRAGYFFKSICTVTNFSHSNPPITFLTTSRLYPTLQFIFLFSFGSVFGLLRNYMYSIHVHCILYKNPRS